MLDTNIFVSMLFFPSEQTRELAVKLTDNHQIVICDYVIEELRLVVERKFPTGKESLEKFFLELPYELVHSIYDSAVKIDTAPGLQKFFCGFFCFLICVRQ